MARAPWTADHPLVRWILANPRNVEFFQLLQLLERARPEVPKLGTSGPAREEILRIRPALTLGFPAGDIHDVEWHPEGTYGSQRLLITTTFMGLYGPDAPLPAHATESLLSETEDDRRVRGFLDLIHHRIYSLIYRVWKKYRYHVTFDGAGNDAISLVVRGFLGIATPHAEDALGVSALRLFRYAGLMTQQPASAAGLAGMLRDYFGEIPFEIEQCVGRWLPIDRVNQNRLGGMNCSLGEDLLIGERLFDRGGKFRVRIGPVDFDTFVDFMPTGKCSAQVADLVRFYSTDPLEFDTEVILRGDEVPPTMLRRDREPVTPQPLGRLGWTTWLSSAEMLDQTVIFDVPAGDATRSSVSSPATGQ